MRAERTSSDPGTITAGGYAVPTWVRVRREAFGLLFYDTRSTKLTFVRSGNALVPPPFTGGRRPLEIACDNPAQRQTVLRLLGRLESKGLLQGDDGATEGANGAAVPVANLPADRRGAAVTSVPANDHLLAPADAAGSLHEQRLRAPVNVTWEITEVCNLSCRHCLSADLRARRAGELDFAECSAVVDQLAAMEVFQINFGGGEPFLRDDFLDLLRYCQGKGITTCVSTNGTTLTEDLVTQLLAMDGLYLQVSLDGARPETNDAIRGQGTFARIMAGVRLLADRRFPDFSLNMVVTRLNFDEIADFGALAADLGAKTRLSRFRPSGGGCSTWDDYRLTREQLTGLSVYLGDHDEILTGDSFFALTPESRRAMGLQMCGAAKMTLALAPDGSVYPCAFLSDPAFLAGHVNAASLGVGPAGDVPSGTLPLAEVFAHAPVLERLRDLEVASCRACDRFSVCHGGCPAVAYFLTRSIGLPDPECLRAATSVPASAAAPLSPHPLVLASAAGPGHSPDALLQEVS